MPYLKVGSLAALPPGSVMQVEVGPDTLAICNAGGEVHALDGICLHAGGPLGEGALHGTTLVCPWHAWEYDCVTGGNSYDDSLKLVKFPVKIAGDDILVEVP
jgi:nitrite reductase/ring-hydroxylating ferredoxin subunit